MPKFTIAKDGRIVGQIDAHGDRIEMGSARTCQVQIDDLLISLKQATFVKPAGSSSYFVEPVSRIPVLSVNGIPLTDRTEISDGALLAIEGYTITVNYVAGEFGATPAGAAVVSPRAVASVTPANEPPLPPPLEPDLPPPLEPSNPVIPAPVVTAPVAPSSDNADMERTVFVRRIGRIAAVSGPLSGKHWDLKSGETRIGREQGQNDIVVRFDSQGNVDNSVSRRHASIHVVGDRVFVEDVGSAAGTFVNGSSVPTRQRVEIRGGDQVEIRSSRESTVLRIELDRPAVSTAAPAPQPAPSAQPNMQPEPVRVAPAAPMHDPVVADLRADDPPIERRRRRADAGRENIFVPIDEPRKSGKIPTWGWIVAGAGLLLLIVILILIAL